MIEFTCEQCGRTVRVDDQYAGKRGQCPHCSARVTIPGADQPPTAPPPPGVPPSAAAYAAPPGASPPGKTAAVCALVFGILAIIPLLGLAFGLVALILGIVAISRRTPAMAMAIVGIVLGVVLAFLGTTIGTSVLLPSLGRARELARQSVCVANLKAIGIAMHEYAAGHDDQYPDLDDLIKGGYIVPSTLKCPSAPGERDNDYIFLKPDASTPGGQIVACDRKGNHKGQGRSVLYASASAKWMGEAEFQAELRKPVNEAFAKHLRAEEGP